MENKRYFTSEKHYYSIESHPNGFRALKAFKQIKDDDTTESEAYKVFPTLAEAMEWVKNG